MSIGLMQRVLAGYRVPFFDMLSRSIPGGLSLYAGSARPEEMIDNSKTPEHARLWQADNRYLFSGRAQLCYQRDALRWLKEIDPEVLIMEANLRYPMSFAAAQWMRRRHRPVIGWGLGTGKMGGLISKLHLSRYDALITYSVTGKRAYEAAGFPSDKIFLAKNAVTPKPQREMVRRPNHFEGAPVLLYVGRLQPRKRLDLLIRVCAELPEALKPQLVITGDGNIRQNLETLAKEVYPQTTFTGALYGDELTAIFDSADLFVLPGTGGLALQQAMASALPLIAAEADGTQADLVREENGIQVAAGEKDALKDAIIRLLSDPVQLRRMGEASFRIVSEEINLEAMTEGFLQAIRSVRQDKC